MKEYIKIQTVYNRDIDGTKKLILGSFRDESVKFLSQNEWTFTEKIDGTNIRIMWDGYTVSIGGRTDKAVLPQDLKDYLSGVFCTVEAQELFEQKFGCKEVTIYGEGYGGKIQGVGKLYRNDVSFIMFDALIGAVWMSRGSVEDIARCFGVDVVPIVLSGTLQQGIDFVRGEPKSTIGTANMEGVVGRPKIEMRDGLGNRIIVKIKVRDFT